MERVSVWFKPQRQMDAQKITFLKRKKQEEKSNIRPTLDQKNEQEKMEEEM